MNLYNPCKRLSLEVLDELIANFEGIIICCGDHIGIQGNETADKEAKLKTTPLT